MSRDVEEIAVEHRQEDAQQHEGEQHSKQQVNEEIPADPEQPPADEKAKEPSPDMPDMPAAEQKNTDTQPQEQQAAEETNAPEPQTHTAQMVQENGATKRTQDAVAPPQDGEIDPITQLLALAASEQARKRQKTDNGTPTPPTDAPLLPAPTPATQDLPANVLAELLSVVAASQGAPAAMAPPTTAALPVAPPQTSSAGPAAGNMSEGVVMDVVTDALIAALEQLDGKQNAVGLSEAETQVMQDIIHQLCIHLERKKGTSQPLHKQEHALQQALMVTAGSSGVHRGLAAGHPQNQHATVDQLLQHLQGKSAPAVNGWNRFSGMGGPAGGPSGGPRMASPAGQDPKVRELMALLEGAMGQQNGSHNNRHVQPAPHRAPAGPLHQGGHNGHSAADYSLMQGILQSLPADGVGRQNPTQAATAAVDSMISDLLREMAGPSGGPAMPQGPPRQPIGFWDEALQPSAAPRNHAGSLGAPMMAPVGRPLSGFTMGTPQSGFSPRLLQLKQQLDTHLAQLPQMGMYTNGAMGPAGGPAPINGSGGYPSRQDTPHDGLPGGRRAGPRLDPHVYTLEYLQLQGLLSMPEQDAAQKLGVGVNTLKRHCRRLGLKRWPGRKLRAEAKRGTLDLF